MPKQLVSHSCPSRYREPSHPTIIAKGRSRRWHSLCHAARLRTASLAKHAGEINWRIRAEICRAGLALFSRFHAISIWNIANYLHMLLDDLTTDNLDNVTNLSCNMCTSCHLVILACKSALWKTWAIAKSKWVYRKIDDITNIICWFMLSHFQHGHLSHLSFMQGLLLFMFIDSFQKQFYNPNPLPACPKQNWCYLIYTILYLLL